ncbi:MAG: hypothetical protein HFI21_16250 [Lachnospiraceae bacterium]|nr:hypothetical protein [Lachnospiraceae bacterium]
MRTLCGRQNRNIGYYGTGIKTVISFTMHKSIYRHMFLWLEIDFIPVYCEGYYGTGIKNSNILQSAQIDLQTRILRLEIDFIPVYFEGYYGTQIGGT